MARRQRRIHSVQKASTDTEVFADQGETLEIRALTVGQDYYFVIEAFDENGVSAW